MRWSLVSALLTLLLVPGCAERTDFSAHVQQPEKHLDPPQEVQPTESVHPAVFRAEHSTAPAVTVGAPRENRQEHEPEADVPTGALSRSQTPAASPPPPLLAARTSEAFERRQRRAVSERPNSVVALDSVEHRAVREALSSAINASPFPAVLRRLYADQGGEPLFHRGLGLHPEAFELHALVLDLPSHAIDEEPYGMEAELIPARSPAAAATLDVQLATAVVRYVLDFRFIYRAHPRFVTRDVEALVAEKEDAIVVTASEVFPNVAQGLRALWPTDLRYEAVRSALPDWEVWAEKSRDMPTVPVHRRTIEPGNRHSAVRALQRRLAFQEYYEGEATGVLDEDTVEAVKRFQHQHQLTADGRPGLETFTAMRVSLRTRYRQLKLSLQRWREYRPAREGAENYLVINIAGFAMEHYVGGQRVDSRPVIVGNNRLDYNRNRWRQGHLNRTPFLKTKLYKVVLNPVWIVPRRIRDTEISAARANSGRFRQVSKGGSADGYLIQGPGRRNPLGRVKFLLEDTNGIYLHDTDRRGLFQRGTRALSHGCIRVSDAVEFAKAIVTRHSAASAELVDRVLEGYRTRVLELHTPLTVYSVYNSVGVDPEGQIVFYPDSYDYDRAYYRGELPVSRWTRYGSPAMRPRDVPAIPFRDYTRLRAEGGVAPRDWPPASDPSQAGAIPTEG